MEEKLDILRECQFEGIDIGVTVQNARGTNKKTTSLDEFLPAILDDQKLSTMDRHQLEDLFSSFSIDFSMLLKKGPLTGDELASTEQDIKSTLEVISEELDSLRPHLQAGVKWEAIEARVKASNIAYEKARSDYRFVSSKFQAAKERR